MSPSGLRLGVQELTRVGMGKDEMLDVAKFYARVLLKMKILQRSRLMFEISNRITMSFDTVSMKTT